MDGLRFQEVLRRAPGMVSHLQRPSPSLELAVGGFQPWRDSGVGTLRLSVTAGAFLPVSPGGKGKKSHRVREL